MDDARSINRSMIIEKSILNNLIAYKENGSYNQNEHNSQKSQIGRDSNQKESHHVTHKPEGVRVRPKVYKSTLIDKLVPITFVKSVLEENSRES